MKYLLILLLIVNNSYSQIGFVASSYYAEPKVARFVDYFSITGQGTSASYRYSLTRLANDLKGYANAAYSTTDALNGRLDTCFYVLYPMLGNTAYGIIRDYITFNISIAYAPLALAGSPTISNAGITTNGVNQYARVDYNRTIATTANIMSSNGISNTDTARQTGFNYHLYIKDSADQFLVGSSSSGGGRVLMYMIGTSLSSYAYNTINSQGSIDFTRSTTNRRGFYMQNRKGLSHEIYINGAVAASYTNSSYNFNFPYNGTGQILLQFNTFSNYFAATMQYFAIAKRGFTSGEAVTYNNIIQAFVNSK